MALTKKSNEIIDIYEEISIEMRKARAAIEQCEQCAYQKLCSSGEICVYSARGKINQVTAARLTRQAEV